MKTVVVRVIDRRDPSVPVVHKVQVDQSGFIYISHDRVRFSPNILDLQASEDTLKIQLDGEGVFLQSVPYYTNFLYSRVLHELPLLFKRFDRAHEPVDIRDQFIINNNLYIVKFTNFNGTFKLNNVS